MANRTTKLLAVAMTICPQTAGAADIPWPCHFKGGAVIGCNSARMENVRLAAELWQRFRYNSEELDKPYVRQVLAESLCRVVRNDNSHVWKIKARGPKSFATMSGFEPILIVYLSEIGQILFMSAHYVEGKCPLPDVPTVHVVDPAHPYD